MSCEECINYKPKPNEVLKEIRNSFSDYCGSIACSKCPIKETNIGCSILKAWDEIDELLL